MTKYKWIVLLSAVLCCAAASVSCKKDSSDTNVAAMIMGKWIAADCDGQENREWWEVAINGSKMNWTALRKNKDGSTFTVSFEMNRVL